MQAYGLVPDTAAILFVGGVLSLGLGSVIDALRSPRVRSGTSEGQAAGEAPLQTSAQQAIGEEPAPTQIPARFGRKAAEATVATAVVAAAGAAMASSATGKTAEAPKNSVADTLAALDEAKADIKKALGGMDSMTSHEEHVEPVHAATRAAASSAAEIAADDATDVDPNLFVVEEKIIRGRPARILSDETVEAETDEGWMRFENLEHLNEYLDSTEEPEA